MANFVVAHGAWTGGWSWEKVIPLIEKAGHRIYVPTLTGLAERSHLAGPEVNLDTHIMDIVNEVTFKQLKDVVLIGHSYGGIVATGAVEKLKSKVKSIVYLDAFIPDDGMSFSSYNPEWKEKGPMVKVPDFGGEIDFRSTAQPIKTMTQKLKVTGAYQKVKKKTFIVCTGWEGPFADLGKRATKGSSWIHREIKSGHDAPMEKPKELTKLLLKAI